MLAFRTFLGVVLVGIVVYTAIVGINHGWNLLPIFFGDITKMNWPGQFNLDFLGLLLLSGLWVSWRHEFSPAGIALGLVAVFGGFPFLSTYLLIVSLSTSGDMATLLLGTVRAKQFRRSAA